MFSALDSADAEEIHMFLGLPRCPTSSTGPLKQQFYDVLLSHIWAPLVLKGEPGFPVKTTYFSCFKPPFYSLVSSTKLMIRGELEHHALITIQVQYQSTLQRSACGSCDVTDPRRHLYTISFSDTSIWKHEQHHRSKSECRLQHHISGALMGWHHEFISDYLT